MLENIDFKQIKVKYIKKQIMDKLLVYLIRLCKFLKTLVML